MADPAHNGPSSERFRLEHGLRVHWILDDAQGDKTGWELHERHQLADHLDRHHAHDLAHEVRACTCPPPRWPR